MCALVLIIRLIASSFNDKGPSYILGPLFRIRALYPGFLAAF